MSTYDTHDFFMLGDYAGRYGSGSHCPYRSHWRLRSWGNGWYAGNSMWLEENRN